MFSEISLHIESMCFIHHFCVVLPVVLLYKPCSFWALKLLNLSSLVGDDLVAMAANLDKLIAKPPPSKNLTFRISAGISKEDTPDEKALLGAHWSDKMHFIDHHPLDQDLLSWV